MIKNFLKSFRRAPVRLPVRLGWVTPLVWLCCRFVRRIKRDDSNGPVLLALNPARFRGDLEILAEEEGLTICLMPFAWQSFFFTCFYKEDDNCILDREEPRIFQARAAYRGFLRKFLPRFYDVLGVDAVICAAIHYRQDYDIFSVSRELGVPALVLQREGNLGSKATQQQFEARCVAFGRFHGTKLLVHSAIQQDIAIDAGYVAPEQVVVGGNIRMDRFVRNVRAGAYEGRARFGRVTFFSFGPGTGNIQAFPPHWPDNPENYLLEFCRDTHCAVARFARNNPSIDVVIKAKWGGGWIANVEALLESRGLRHTEIPNLSITGDGDAQKMIAQSDVVVAFGSTTLLESALMGRPTVLPYFQEAASDRMADFVFYRDDFDCFDVAYSPEELEALIKTRLTEFVLEPSIIKRRIQVFEKYVSFWDGSAAKKFVSELSTAIEQSANRATPRQGRKKNSSSPTPAA